MQVCIEMISTHSDMSQIRINENSSAHKYPTKTLTVIRAQVHVFHREEKKDRLCRCSHTLRYGFMISVEHSDFELGDGKWI